MWKERNLVETPRKSLKIKVIPTLTCSEGNLECLALFKCRKIIFSSLEYIYRLTLTH